MYGYDFSSFYWFCCSSNANPPFWIPIHIVIPERPTECAVFNVNAGILLIYSAL